MSKSKLSTLLNRLEQKKNKNKARKKNPNGISVTKNGTVIASGRRAVDVYRILALKQALKLETLGLKMGRNINAAQLVRDQFGWKTRDKKKLLAQLEEWISIHLRPEEESQKSQLMPDLPVRTRENNPFQEWLFWMPGYESRDGYVPGLYVHVTHEWERREALKHGGIDVSHREDAWRAYDQQVNDDYESRY